VCEKCTIAVNKEIIDEQSMCPVCSNPDLISKKAIEVGNIFKLHQRFTSAFGFTFTDHEGKQQTVEMGCYGMGPSRIMGTIVELFHDERGIIWPASIAPYHVHLIALGKEDEAYEEAEKLCKELLEKNIEVLYDDRRDVAAGEKFADADLIGVPYRVVVSKKTLAENSVEVKKRTETEASLVPLTDITSSLSRT
jgi:prolyl-tRNA synthetase